MNDWRKQFLFFSVIGMMAALFLSRALLSICMGSFVILSFLHTGIKSQFRQFFSSPLLWSMSLLLLIPLLSGCWSDNKAEWLNVIRIKLPLLLMPFAFAAPISFSPKQWRWLAFIFIGIVAMATIWSISHYVVDAEAVNKSYLEAKTIVTPLANDHVRFSWLVSISIMLCGLMAWQTNKNTRFLLLLVAAWFIIYLHLLAARTGLLSFYIMLAALAIWLLTRKGRVKDALGPVLLILLLPLLSYWFLPSFQNRVRYILYDYEYFSEMHYLPGGNDASRVISLRAGWNVLQTSPFYGVGAGDIGRETRDWEKIHYPDMLPADMIYPSSEWLIYGLTAGWPGMLLFSFIMCIPLFIKRQYQLVWIVLNLTAAGSFLFDTGLEVQYGVFIYTFTVLWWWKWLKPQKEITLNHD